MTSLTNTKPSVSDRGEEKYQDRTPVAISDSEFAIQVELADDTVNRRVRYGSLVYLHFKITDPETLRKRFRTNIESGNLSIWMRLGPTNGTFLHRKQLSHLGECFIFPKKLLYLPSKVEQLLEHDIEESEAIRLLARAHQDVDKALEYWFKEKMADQSDDSIYESSDWSDSDDPFEDEPFEEETSEEMLLQLINLGFAREAAEVALVASDNDLLSAVQMLSISSISPTPELIEETDEELVERVVTESKDKRTGSIHQSETEEILKVVWAVRADEIADWLLEFYDEQNKVLVFFVKCCEHTDKVQVRGTTIELSLDLFRGDSDKQTLARYGIFTTYVEAMTQVKFKEKLQKDYTLAREAAEGLRPTSGGEFKNSWEPQRPQGPQGPNKDQTELRKILEMKLKDVSARAARARLLGAPERRVQRFVDAAIVYITERARVSGYQIVRKPKLHRQRSEGGGRTHTLKLFRQRTN